MVVLISGLEERLNNIRVYDKQMPKWFWDQYALEDVTPLFVEDMAIQIAKWQSIYGFITGCLVGDERVIMANGTIELIGNLGKNHLDIVDRSVLTGRTPSDGAQARATTFFKYEAQPVVEIITQSGKSIKGTYNHPVLVIVSGFQHQQKWVPLGEIRVGDKLQTVTSYQCKATNLARTTFVAVSRHYGPRFRGRLPEFVTPNFAALLGYMLGDGFASKDGYKSGFVVIEPEIDILAPLLDFVKDAFNLTPLVYPAKLDQGRTVPMMRVEIDSKDVSHNLQFLRTRRVPPIIFRSPNHVVAQFLRWLFEADGSMSIRRSDGRKVKFVINLKGATNIELLRDVQLLLLRWGIYSRIDDKNLSIGRSVHIARFAEHIGFASIKKRTKLQAAVENIKNLNQEKIRKKSDAYEKVKKIVYHPELQDVYDIEVPGAERFVANGIISHNSPGEGKSLLGQSIAYTVAEITERPFIIAQHLKSGTVEAQDALSAAKDFDTIIQDENLRLHGQGTDITTDAVSNLLKTVRIRQINFWRIGNEFDGNRDYRYVLITKFRDLQDDDYRKTNWIAAEIWMKVYLSLEANYLPVGMIYYPVPEEYLIKEYINKEKMKKVRSVQSERGIVEREGLQKNYDELYPNRGPKEEE